MIAVLMLAALLRWVEPAVIEFKYDEAHILQLSRNVARGVSLPLLTGGTSLGIERPPLDVYLLALPLAALGQRPEAAAWLVGALGVIAVALTYQLGRNLGGAPVGILAALFMAANPWLVHYDRKLWAHIQAVLSVALLLLAWQVVIRQRGRAAFWFFVLAALQLLTHVLALLQALSWLGAVLVAPHRWRRKESAYGLVVGVLLLLPYLLALFTTRNDTATALNWNSEAGSITLNPGQSWSQLASLIGGSGLPSLAGRFASDSPWWQAATLLAWPVLILVVIGVLQALSWARRGPNAPGARLLLAWGLGPFLALSLAAPVYQQYWTVLQPLPALLFAIGVQATVRGATSLLERMGSTPSVRRTRLLWGGALALALVVTVGWAGSYLHVLAAVREGAGTNAFGAPLLRWQSAVKTAEAWAQRIGLDTVLVAVQGVDPRFDDEPAVVTALLTGPTSARFVAPSAPYALVDERYELEPGVLALTVGGHTWPWHTYPSGPGAISLSEDRPSLVLWTVDRPDWAATLDQVGETIWEGLLADGRPSARLYLLPARAELWQRLGAAASRMAGGLPAEKVRVVTNLADSPLLRYIPFWLPTEVMPTAANDLASAVALAQSFPDGDVSRVVFVDQPSGWWDNERIARAALGDLYAPIVDTQVALWPVTVYERVPLGMSPVDWTFVEATDTQQTASLRLVQAAVTAPDNSPGGVVGVHLAWQAPATWPHELKITLQLLDASGSLAAQVDQPLDAGAAASGMTSHGLRLPENLVQGRYRLIMAVYDPQTGQRLLVQPGDVDHVELGRVQVQ